MIRPALLVIVAFGVGCSSPLAPEAAAPPEIPTEGGTRFVRLSRSAARAAGVETAAVELVAFAEEIEVAGRVALDEDRTARVGSFVEGVVVDCCKSVGAFVRKDAPLAKIHSHATHEIVAEYVTTKAALRGRQSELEYARQAHERAMRLLELKAGSLQAAQRSETDLRAAEAAMAGAEAAVHRALAHLDFLGLDPAAVESPAAGEEPVIVVRAPSSGTIVERAVKLGDVVTPSTEMYVVSDLSRLWVIAQVPEQRLAAMRPGMQVEVRTRAFPDRTFTGRVTQVSSELNPETMTVQVRCSLANPDGALKTGMYATVVLRSETMRSALAVPEEALQRLGDETVVFVAAGEDAFEIRPVRAGERTNGDVEILDGLRAGERIAVAGAFVLMSEHRRSELRGEE